jgi:hypothetical protein
MLDSSQEKNHCRHVRYWTGGGAWAGSVEGLAGGQQDGMRIPGLCLERTMELAFHKLAPGSRLSRAGRYPLT